MLENVWLFLYVAFSISTIAIVIADMNVFAPWKRKVRNEFFSKLLCCSYCLGFWLWGAYLLLWLILPGGYTVFLHYAMLLPFAAGVSGLISILTVFLIKAAKL
jgi:hypothetical protein